VLNPLTLTQMAEWHGHIDPDLFGDELVKLALYFNEAILGIEVNNHGLTTITSARKRYGKLFTRVVPKATDPSENEERLGWRTDSRTKPMMEDHLNEVLREDTVVVRSRETVSEFISYVVHDNGSTGANDACYDDRAIAFMIALQVAKLHRLDPQKAAERRARKRQITRQFSRNS